MGMSNPWQPPSDGSGGSPERWSSGRNLALLEGLITPVGASTVGVLALLNSLREDSWQTRWQALAAFLFLTAAVGLARTSKARRTLD